MRQRLSARIRVALAPDDAFQLFTPSGEREWAHGWHPRFPAPTSDDSEPGTVFETDTHGGQATWLVTERVRGERIAYVQVIPGERAGRITVTLEATEGESEVEVTYEMTPLSPAGAHSMKQFADGYGEYLRSWQDAIAECLEQRAAA
ncbi:MAG: SRPBCC family protein [Solirubrobacteraceae bacterium]